MILSTIASRYSAANFRGLESYTKEGSKRRQLFRVKQLVSLLREQRRQRACGEVLSNGPELLRAACSPVSAECEELAYQQAKRDEKDAMGVKDKPEADQSPSMLLHLTRLFRDPSGDDY